jgi:hypothetical protein
MFAAVGRLPAGRDHSLDDIENCVRAVALTVDDRPFLKRTIDAMTASRARPSAVSN